MAVRAEQTALGCLTHDELPSLIRQRSHVELKLLFTGLHMMELQRAEVFAIAAFGAFPSHGLNKKKLPFPTALLLANIALVVIVRVLILAFAAAKLGLATA